MNISQAEWQVMRVLWAYPNSRSSEVVTRLEEDFAWKPATVKTLLNRLKGKGLIQMEKREGKFYYRAEVAEEQHLQDEWHSFFENVCQTKHGELLSSMVAEASLSASAIKDLIELLEKRLETAPSQVICACSKGQCSCHHACERK
ncbi:BlaI/MecI/CopY family transcriptional regulator [Streptococcus himalayensis]|uniref:Transcriptional regulator n=1 Tax=Streptococcus himalayensis TaxID=1888195 RepID=A0A917EEQ7_9STRE|nr:BlaI/MecI/CopY family transcriptional regulator [Streptococcus himalayensis]GGE24733.1 transcriptional regulator [Streptococcus himalayensis]